MSEGGRVLCDRAIGCPERALFRLASSSKLFVSVAALRLVDQGLLSLDQSVSTVLPEHAEEMTIMDLLRHSCGYGYGDTEPYGDALRSAGLMYQDTFGMNSWTHDLTLRDWARALADVPHEDPPGTVTRYGLGHDLLGAVMESTCSKSLDQILAEEVLEPLDLNNTFFIVPPDRQADLTDFHNYSDGSLKPVENSAESPFLTRPKAFSGGGGWDMLGNGGLVSSAGDFHRLLQTILAEGTFNGEQVLSRELSMLLLQSQTSELKISEIQPGCGYSLGVACVDDPKGYQGLAPCGTLWWGGSTNTFYFYRPDQGLCGVFLTNTFPFGHMNAIYRFLSLSNG